MITSTTTHCCDVATFKLTLRMKKDLYTMNSNNLTSLNKYHSCMQKCKKKHTSHSPTLLSQLLNDAVLPTRHVERMISREKRLLYDLFTVMKHNLHKITAPGHNTITTGQMYELKS